MSLICCFNDIRKALDFELKINQEEELKREQDKKLYSLTEEVSLYLDTPLELLTAARKDAQYKGPRAGVCINDKEGLPHLIVGANRIYEVFSYAKEDYPQLIPNSITYWAREFFTKKNYNLICYAVPLDNIKLVQEALNHLEIIKHYSNRNHPMSNHIVRLHAADTLEDPKKNLKLFYLIFDCFGQSLSTGLRCYVRELPTLRHIVKNLLTGLFEMSKENIIQREISCRTISLLRKEDGFMYPRYCGFKYVSAEQLLIPTELDPRCCAPELLSVKNQKELIKYTTGKADVWSLATTIYLVYYRTPLYWIRETISGSGILANLQQDWSHQTLESLSLLFQTTGESPVPPIKDPVTEKLILYMLKKKPKDRPSPRQALEYFDKLLIEKQEKA